MKPLGKAYKEAEASTGDFARLPEGGYVIKITAVEDKDDKEYLNIIYDIAEGEHAGFYSDAWSKEHPFAHSFIRSYKETAFGMFKGFLRAIDETNGTKFEEQAAKGLAEQQLVGKLLGAVIGSEEYETNRGEVKTRLRVASVMSAERIRKGDFKIPELKKLENQSAFSKAVESTDGFAPIKDEDVPF